MDRDSIFCNSNQSNNNNNNINNIYKKKKKELCINKVHSLFSTEGHIFLIDSHFHTSIYKNENNISTWNYNDKNININNSKEDKTLHKQKIRSCKYSRRKDR
jgi:hypothetical protein